MPVRMADSNYLGFLVILRCKKNRTRLSNTCKQLNLLVNKGSQHHHCGGSIIAKSQVRISLEIQVVEKTWKWNPLTSTGRKHLHWIRTTNPQKAQAAFSFFSFPSSCLMARPLWGNI